MYQIPPIKYRAKKATAIKKLPDNWLDFVRLLKIKSGETYKQFTPFDYQIKLIELAEKEETIIICKSRQLGITQSIASLFLYRATQNKAYTAICYMRNQEDSSALSRRVRDMVGQLGDYGIEAENDNVGHLKLKGLGEIYFKNSSREGARSYDSVSDFLFDECAFIPTIESIYSASSACSSMVEKSTKFLVSTPSTKSGFYWNMIQQYASEDIELKAEKVARGDIDPFQFWRDKNICKIFIHWKSHPKYSKIPNYLEYRKDLDNTSWEVIRREYDLCFEDSSISIFSSELVRNGICDELPDSTNFKEYFAGIDTATIGDDYFVCMILEYDSLLEVLTIAETYRKRKQTLDYNLFKCGELLKKYQPYTGIEINGTGQIFYEKLSDQFPDLAFLPIRTTAQSKPGLISRLQIKLEQGKIKYNGNNPIIDELLSFQRKGNKLEAANGKHDDLVMALSFAIQSADKYCDRIGSIEFKKSNGT